MFVPSCLFGQSKVFSGFDILWERVQSHNHWLYQIDNKDWKTWILHGAITYAGGSLLNKVTPLSSQNGRRVVASFYFIRELNNITLEGNKKWGDAFMDALTPALVAEIRF